MSLLKHASHIRSSSLMSFMMSLFTQILYTPLTVSLKHDTKLHSLHPNFQRGAEVSSSTSDPEQSASGHAVIALEVIEYGH